MAAPRRHLALVCFLHQAWRDTLDQAVDMYGKLLDRNRKRVDERLDDMLKAQRHAVDRIVQRYRRLGAVLLDPDVGDDELRARLLSIVAGGEVARGPVRPGELDARRPEGPLRADGRAARRAEPVRRAVSEQDEVRRRAGRGSVADAGGATGLPRTPRGGAPRPADPMCRSTSPHRRCSRSSVTTARTDRRRWESALFLKVRDEIQTGNLAIEGAKNFGRFEAFFLPTAQWEQVRDAFWARTGFPVDPDAAVEQLNSPVGCVRPLPGRCR